MCRWFAYVSESEECLLQDVLITPEHGISNQVNDHYLPHLLPHLPDSSASDQDKLQKEIAARNLLNNIDGLGLAIYTPTLSSFTPSVTGSRPLLYKTTSPPLADPNFRFICSNTSTTCLFAHIRASSGSPTVTTNNHPFVFGRHSIMHNGSVSDFTTIRRALHNSLDADTYANIQGSTDSETIAALYMMYLTSGRGKASWELEYPAAAMSAALNKTIAMIITTQLRHLPPATRRANSLNLAATDGRRLVSYRFRNHATEQPPSLYYSTTAGVTLNRRYPGHPNKAEAYEREANRGEVNRTALRSTDEHGKHIIVASEPTTYKEEEWTLIGKNCCVIVEVDGSMEVGPALYEDGWDADGP